MPTERETRPSGWGAGLGRAAGQHPWTAQTHGHLTPDDGLILKTRKRGRLVTLGKIVTYRGERIFGTPYQGRREVTDYVSLPPRALAILREHGVSRWVLRFGSTGLGYSLPIDVAAQAPMRASEGRGEHFVPLGAFEPCEWPTWGYVTDDDAHIIDIDEACDEPPAPSVRQASLWGGVQ